MFHLWWKSVGVNLGWCRVGTRDELRETEPGSCLCNQRCLYLSALGRQRLKCKTCWRLWSLCLSCGAFLRFLFWWALTACAEVWCSAGNTPKTGFWGVCPKSIQSFLLFLCYTWTMVGLARKSVTDGNVRSSIENTKRFLNCLKLHVLHVCILNEGCQLLVVNNTAVVWQWFFFVFARFKHHLNKSCCHLRNRKEIKNGNCVLSRLHATKGSFSCT